MNGVYRPLSACEGLAVYELDLAGRAGLTTAEFHARAPVSKSFHLGVLAWKINRKSPGLVCKGLPVYKRLGELRRYYLRHHAPAPP